MKKTSMRFLLLGLLLTLVFALAACGGGGDDAETPEVDESALEKPQPNEDGTFNIEDFPQRMPEGEVQEGGTLNFGLVSDTAFEGTLNFNFYGGTPDEEILKWFDESLLAIDENYQYTQDGAATFEYSDDYKVWTFTIRDEVKWHDGEPVTAEDWAFSYEIIGHPDYEGVRYGSDFTIIEGMEEYKAGEADSISGIEVIDEKTLQITYKDPTPSLLAGGIWPYATPKHVFEGIEVKDMPDSDPVRKNPIGMGPFKVESITPGESVVFKKFEDYWQGEPKLDEVVLRVVDPSVVANELASGKLDVVDSFNTDLYVDNQDMEGVVFLGEVDNAYTYIGFKLGTWDKENSRVNYNPEESIVGDVELRRAMWYAVDNDAVGKRFYDGFRWAGTTLIAPSHADFHDDSIEVPTYDPDKANEILDEAGYEDVDGDGFREDPDGNELVINFASMSGGDIAEPLANYYIQAWNEVGLNVQLLDGRLQEFNTFYDRVGDGGNDDPEVHVYMGAWSVGSDVDPAGLYGPDAMFNFPRYESEENSRLLEEGVSEKAFELDYRIEVYKEWQELMVEEIPVFPTLYRAKLVPVNENIRNYSAVHTDLPHRHLTGFVEGADTSDSSEEADEEDNTDEEDNANEEDEE
ncbi:MAG TPA: oligopeptide ABC transporter substrate-binding protein [Pseudogracilibacillus sp.]|nr:oligopeptide ABC transporter substrate-binding protein [Pseudogracilibacillus sp.]